MRHPLAPRGVLFDLDGTLYDKAPVEREVMRQLRASLLLLWRYTTVRKSLAGLDLGTHEQLFAEAVRRVQPWRALDEAVRSWIRERYDPAVLAAVQRVAAARPGLNGLLQELREGGVRLAVVSDYLGVASRLEALGIDPSSFDVVVETEGLGMMKPASRVLAVATERLAVASHELVVVGDRSFCDEALARLAGGRFVGVADPGSKERGPDWYGWTEACAVLRQLRDG